MILKREPSVFSQAVSILVMGFFLAVLSTTLFAWWPASSLKLQAVVIMVVAAGFRLPLGVGGLVVLFLGYISDLVSGGFVGLQLMAFMAVFCLCSVAQLHLAIDSWPLQVAGVGAMSIFSQLLIFLGLALTNRQYLAPDALLLTFLSQAAFTALLAPLFLALLDRLVKLADHFWTKQERS